MFINIHTPKEIEALGMNVNNPYFHSLFQEAWEGLTTLLTEVLDTSGVVIHPDNLPKPEHAYIKNMRIGDSLSPYTISLEWAHPSINLDNEDEFFSIVDQLPEELRHQARIDFTGRSLNGEIIFISRAGKGEKMKNGEYLRFGPRVSLQLTLKVGFSKEYENILKDIGRIETNHTVYSYLSCGI